MTERVSVSFYRGAENEPFINRLTQRLTGDFVHCELVFNNPETGSHNLSCGVWQNEEVFFRPKTFGRTTWTFRSVNLPQEKVRAMKAFCRGEAANKKPFNKWGLVRCISPFPKPSDGSSWFCSELAISAFQKAGVLTDVIPSMTTPSDLYIMLGQMNELDAYQDASPLAAQRIEANGLRFERLGFGV